MNFNRKRKTTEMNEKLLNHTPIFDLVEKQDDGSIGFNPVGVNSNDWITVIVERQGKWLMETQLRYGIMKKCLEFPSGIVEAGEDFAAAASRELSEETGIYVEPSALTYLGQFAANPAFMSNRMRYFYVNLDKVSHVVGETKFDQHEKIETAWMNKEDAIRERIGNAEKEVETNVSVFFAGAMELMRLKGIL